MTDEKSIGIPKYFWNLLLTAEYERRYCTCTQTLHTSFRKEHMAIEHTPVGVPIVPMSDKERDYKLMLWKQANISLKAAKAVEMEFRKDLVANGGMFSDVDTGTETYNLGHGYSVKATKKLNYILEDGDELALALAELRNLSDASGYKTIDLIKFKASLSLSKYKELDDIERAIIDRVITTKPAAPSLTLIEPKTS